MDVSVESPVSSAGALTAVAGQLAGRPLEEWNAAYVKVENYFHALRVRNKALLGQLVLQVLERAMRRAPAEPDRSATQLAVEEMDRMVTKWFTEVLRPHPKGPTTRFRPKAAWPCCLRTCRANGRTNFCDPARGRRNSSARCAKPTFAPARIFNFQK
jgi:hypothetical protein